MPRRPTPKSTVKQHRVRPRPKAGADDAENITDSVVEMEVQTGAYVNGEFNFKTPNAPIVTNDSISRQHAHSSYEVFDYPGEFDEREEGEAYAKRRIEELQAQHEIVHGQATSRAGLRPGTSSALRTIREAIRTRVIWSRPRLFSSTAANSSREARPRARSFTPAVSRRCPPPNNFARRDKRPSR